MGIESQDSKTPQHALNMYHVPGEVPGTGGVLFHLGLTRLVKGCHYHPHIRYEDSEAQKEVIFSVVK